MNWNPAVSAGSHTALGYSLISCYNTNSSLIDAPVPGVARVCKYNPVVSGHCLGVGKLVRGWKLVVVWPGRDRTSCRNKKLSPESKRYFWGIFTHSDSCVSSLCWSWTLICHGPVPKVPKDCLRGKVRKGRMQISYLYRDEGLGWVSPHLQSLLERADIPLGLSGREGI